jgi:hypothetical protein
MNEVLSDTETGGIKYRVTKMGGGDQMHVFRRILPFIMPIIVTKLKGLKTDPVEIMLIMLRELSGMDDKDFDHIKVKCLSAITRQSDGSRYVPIMSGGREMFMDIDGPDQLHLVGCAINDNILANAERFSNALRVLMPNADTGEAST